MNDHWYRAYGLIIRANRMLVFVPPLESQADLPDVDIEVASLGDLPPGFRTLADGDWLPYPATAALTDDETALRRTADGSLYGFRFRDTSEFVFSADGRRIWVCWDDGVAFDHVAAHVLNSVLGFNLRLRGCACIHASSVVVDGRAAVFVGDSGMGKSTTAGYFARAGFPLLTDDFVALRDSESGVHIEPGYPSLRLFLDSGMALVEQAETDALKPIAPRRSKHYLSLTKSGYPFAQSAAPLGIIYLLGGRGARCESRPVAAPNALVELMHNLYPWSMTGTAEGARDFRMLASLVGRVPVRRLVLPDRLDRLDEALEQVQADFAAYTMKA